MALEIIEATKVKQPLSAKGSIFIALSSFVIGSAIFTMAYLGMKNRSLMGALNQPVLSWMLAHRSASITNAAKIITDIASPMGVIVIVVTIAIIWAIKQRELWRPALLISASAIAIAISTVLKTRLMNSRPPRINMVAPLETDYSFPSGHTIGTIVILLVLGYLIYSRYFSKGRFLAWLVTAIIGTTFIAASRLYLGYHWFTDVIASVGLGFIILAIIILIDRIFVTKLNDL